jgi:hypothetical protein
MNGKVRPGLTMGEVTKKVMELLDKREQDNQISISPIAYHTHNGTDSSQVGGEDLTLTNSAINNATETKHGFLPKLSGNSGDVLHGDGTWGPP